MKSIFRRIHLWLSVPFGLVITLICFSGAMLVFEDEVTELVTPHRYEVTPSASAPLPVGQVLERVAETLPPGVTVTGVNIPSDSRRAWQVSLSRPRRASLYVDPYTGRVTGRNERLAFFQTMFRLHRWLLDSAKPDGGIFWGKLIVGISTLMFVLALITGVAVWWPRNAKALVRSLRIPTGGGVRRLAYGLHVAGGMYALVFLLVMALTGLTWSFGWYRTAFYRVLGAEAKSGGKHGGMAAAETEVSYRCWQQVYEELAAKNPGYRQITLSDGTASVSFGTLGNRRAADRYRFHPRTGAVTEATLYKDASRSDKIRGWIYSVHVGSWGGTLTRVLAFAAALMGAALPLTGYYLWIKRVWRKKRGTRYILKKAGG